jgi:hypothetical protein
MKNVVRFFIGLQIVGSIVYLLSILNTPFSILIIILLFSAIGYSLLFWYVSSSWEKMGPGQRFLVVLAIFPALGIIVLILLALWVLLSTREGREAIGDTSRYIVTGQPPQKRNERRW